MTPCLMHGSELRLSRVTVTLPGVASSSWELALRDSGRDGGDARDADGERRESDGHSCERAR